MKTKILFFLKSIPESENTTPHQRFLLIKSLQGEVFLYGQEANTARQDSVFISKNVLMQLLRLVARVLFLRAHRQNILLWTDHDAFNLTITYLIKKILDIKVVADIWDDPGLIIEIKKDKLGWKNSILQVVRKGFYRIIKNKLYTFDKIIFSISPEVVQKFNKYEWLVKKSLVVTNGISKKSLHAIKHCNRLNRSNDSVWVTYIGYVKKIRGVDTIIEGIDKVHRQVGRFKLLLIGPMDQDDRSWLNGVIANKVWRGDIVLTGELAHNVVLHYIKSSDVLLFPFPRKPELEYIYPIKVFEYVAAEKKVISSDLAGVKKVLENFNGVYLFKAGDAKDFGKCLLKSIRENKTIINEDELFSPYLWEHINKRVYGYVRSVMR